MKISVGQINSHLGSFQENASKILSCIEKSKNENCDLLVFPEGALFGYHPFDLLERKKLVIKQLQAMEKIQKQIPEGLAVLLGLFTLNENSLGRPYYNSAVLLIKGSEPKFFHKTLLPTGDVFDEGRFIESHCMKKNFFQWKKKRFFVTICEDIWAWPDEKGRSLYKENPLLEVKSKNVDCIINLSASPFYLGKSQLRERVTFKTADYFQAPLLYVNMVGGQDEIIFDGGSFLMTPQGEKVNLCSEMKEDFQFFDLNLLKSERGAQGIEKKAIFSPNIENKKISSMDLLEEALVLGIRDFCKKTGLTKVHLGLSGGIDSAVVAVLAVEALGAENVKCFALPGPYNSRKSLVYARQLAENLQIQWAELSITEIYNKTIKIIEKSLKIKEFSLVHENIQARVRGLCLMAYANQSNSLLLSTSNKVEYACGYSTLYGDMCGGLAPLGDLSKQQIYSLALRMNKKYKKGNRSSSTSTRMSVSASVGKSAIVSTRASLRMSSSKSAIMSSSVNTKDRDNLIPEFIIQRPPSAELRPGQKDQDSLPPYESLDRSVVNLVENLGIAKNEIDQWLLPVLMRSEFKRWQAPPILKVSSHGFGRGRRYPIAHKAKE